MDSLLNFGSLHAGGDRIDTLPPGKIPGPLTACMCHLTRPCPFPYIAHTLHGVMMTDEYNLINGDLEPLMLTDT